MTVSRRAVAEFMDRDFDNFTWTKRLTRGALLRELDGLRVPPHFKTDPWLHQLACFYIGMSMPYFMFLLDMGLGKSKLIMDLFTQRVREKRATRALVGVPRLINLASWEDDIKLHSDHEPWIVLPGEIEEKRERLLNPDGDITVIDYQGLTLALCEPKSKRSKKLIINERWLGYARKLYDFIALDEIHKLANANSLWWALMEDITAAAPFVYGMTGTVFGKRVEDVWPQFYLVDRGETFGPNIGIFKAAFFEEKMDPWKGIKHVYRQRFDRKLTRMLGHRSIRYDEDEVLDLPKLTPRKAMLTMGVEQREHYMRALEGLINASGKLKDLDAQWLRMRQISSGYLAWSDGNGDHVIRFRDNPKLDWLEAKVDEMGDSKIVICYDYTETGRMIVERLKEAGHDPLWYWGGAKDKAGIRTRFLTDPRHRVMVMNSEAGGTGNDGLQRVARYMIFYESPPSPTTRKQTTKRIHRPGQNERTFCWDVVYRNSVDNGILEDVMAGIDTHERVVNGRVKSKNFFLR